MAWRIHLTNQAIQNIQILASKPPALAVWTRRRRVHFYDLEKGIPLGEKHLPPVPGAAFDTPEWRGYIQSLTGPNDNIYLPYIRADNTDIYSTDNGKIRLYYQGDKSLWFAMNEKPEALPMPGAARFDALDLDRALGTAAALDENCTLHIYRQEVRIGAFDVGLQPNFGARPAVLVARGSSVIFASDGRRLVSVGVDGRVKQRTEMHYIIGRMVCLPDGSTLITSDMESGVMRAYNGDSLTLTRQRFAIDLVAESTQKQLLADLPPIGTAISAMAAYSGGKLAFAMSGIICVTDMNQMDEIPRTRALS